MANRRFIDFPIAASVGDNDIVLIWQDGLNKQTTKATLFAGSPNSLAGLTDVDISALANGQILQYNSTTSKWENVDRTDIDLDQLGDVTIVSPTNGQVLVYNSSTSKWENSSAGFVPYTGAVSTVNLGAQSILAGSFVKAGGTSAQFLKADGSVDSTAYGTGSVTSVGLTMPSAFSVANSPITTAGTLAVTGAGTVAQYVRGDGSLADFPATTGGGASVSYYLNGSVSQGTIGGVAYREFNRMPVFGAGTDITTNSDGYIASFITDAGDPNKLLIPAGNWNLETYFSASSGGGSPTFYVELYKYDGSTFTLIASNSGSPELIAFGTNLNPYFSTLAVPQTTLALTDRLALRYYVNTSGRTITLHTENDHLCQVITTFTTGLTALNGLTTQVQFFAVGTSGTNFNIASATDTHTFNLPTASATNRGALNSADWSMFNAKQNALTLTTTGNSGASSLIGATLNVPTYTLAGLGGIGGTIASGQVAFGTAANTIGGDNGLFWDNTNKRLAINTTSPSVALEVAGAGSLGVIRSLRTTGAGALSVADHAGRISLGTSSGSAAFIGAQIGVIADANWTVGTSQPSSFVISTVPTSSTTLTERWRITSTGILQSNGAQTIQTSTGNLTLATAAGNGNIVLSPNGTGAIGINTASPTATLDIRVQGSGGSASTASNSIIISPATITDITEGEIGSQIILNARRNGVSDGVSIASVMSTANFDLASMAFYTHTNSSGTPRVESMRIFGGSGNVVIQNGGTFTDTTFRLDVNGTARVQGVLTATANNTTGVLSVINSNSSVSISMASLLAASATGDTYFTVGRALTNNNSALIGHSTVGGGNYAFITVFGRPANDFAITSTGSIGIGTSLPNASARLQIDSTTQGFLPPRMTSTQRNAIASPATGLIVYDTTLNDPFYFNGTAWTMLQDTITLTTTGSSGAATLVGTTLNIPNYGSALSGYLPLTGGTLTGPLNGTSASFSANVGINSSTVNERLVVTQTTNNTSSVGFYTSASTGTSFGPIIQAGTNSSDASLRVFNQGGTSPYLFVRGDGNVGIATDTPSFKLDVNGTGRFTSDLTALSFIKSGGSSSQFLKADGSVDSTNYVPVGRTITINGTTQDLSANRTFNVGTVTGTGTIGQVAFFNGTTSITSESNLFWDSTNDRLGIGTNNPLSILSIRPSTSSSGPSSIEFTNSDNAVISSYFSMTLAVDNSNTVGGRRIVFAKGAKGYGNQVSEMMTIVADSSNVLIGTTDDNGSRLRVNGSIALPHVTKSANYTLDGTDYTVGFDCASNRTANLPDATTCAGRIYVIYQYNTGIGGSTYVTLDGNGSQTIDGVTTYSLQYQENFSSVMIQSTGSNWVVISDKVYPSPV